MIYVNISEKRIIITIKKKWRSEEQEIKYKKNGVIHLILEFNRLQNDEGKKVCLKDFVTLLTVINHIDF